MIVTQCTTQEAVKALFNQLPYSEPKRIALIGGGCSVASEAIAEISQHFGMMQVILDAIIITKESQEYTGLENLYTNTSTL